MRSLLGSCLLLVSIAACGDDSTSGETGGGSGSGSSTSTATEAGSGSGSSSSTTASTSSDASSTSTGTVCEPGNTETCTCNAIGDAGTRTCLADGSAFGECIGCECDQGRSDGCCSGDGACCNCVRGCDDLSDFDPDDAEANALIDCVCNGGTCQDECATECAGGGIGAECAPCVAAAADCQAELAACQ